MRRTVLVGVLVLLTASAAMAAERPSDAEIEALVIENLRATQEGDLAALLATIHPDSPVRSNMARVLQSLKAYELAYEAATTEFVCMQGDFALARVLQQTRRIAGPDFMDNELDGTWALRLDGTEWKYWSQMVLTVDPLPPDSE